MPSQDRLAGELLHGVGERRGLVDLEEVGRVEDRHRQAGLGELGAQRAVQRRGDGDPHPGLLGEVARVFEDEDRCALEVEVVRDHQHVEGPRGAGVAVQAGIQAQAWRAGSSSPRCGRGRAGRHTRRQRRRAPSRCRRCRGWRCRRGGARPAVTRRCGSRRRRRAGSSRRRCRRRGICLRRNRRASGRDRCA